MGHPLETGLGAAVVATGLAERLGLPPAEVTRVRDLALLQHVGCTATAAEGAELVGDELMLRTHAATLDFADKRAMTVFMVQHVGRTYPPLKRPAGFLQAMAGGKRLLTGAADVCESARMLAARCGYDAAHLRDLDFLFENWDGTGFPTGVAGEEITVAARIVQVAIAAVLGYHEGGLDAAIELVRSRSGHSFAPAVVDALVEHAAELLAPLDDEQSVWAVAVGADEEPADIDAILRAVADFVDLKSPYLHGHSAAVARLAAGAGEALGLPSEQVTDLRRAGWVHDLGRVGVSSAIWGKPGHLTPHEREQVRLHPYLTDRVLQHSPYLVRLSAIASAHHERLDGSGYHRGLAGSGLGLLARVLAAADAFQTKLEERPHRPALAPAAAAMELRGLAETGRIDARAVDAVLAAAGEHVGRPTQVAGLTTRELETLRHAASGLSIKQIARAMTISPKTVDGNLQRIYAKIGVSTRAGATLFALQHELLGPGGNGEISP